MIGRLKTWAASAVLIAAILLMGLLVRQYRHGIDSVRLAYTSQIKKRDIVDAARNVIAAVSDAELKVENYVLTGETVYSEAYADDVRRYEDESGTLSLVAVKDPATAAASDLVAASKRTMDELAVIMAVYEKSGREPALDRIRKSSASVYLDRAHDSVAQVMGLDSAGSDGSRDTLDKTQAMSHRLLEISGTGSLLACLGALLVIVPLPRVR